MARLARWVVPGLVHHVLLKGHNGLAVFAQEIDRRTFAVTLHEVCKAQEVVVHAVALRHDTAHLLLRPAKSASLSAAMQAIGRRFVAAYNARHARHGTAWSGRFKASALQPGETTLQATILVDSWARSEGNTTSKAWRHGAREGLVDPAEVWALGNTPFEREHAYAQRLSAGVGHGFEAALARALQRGLPLGDDAFLGELGTRSGRSAIAKPRGRPRRPQLRIVGQ